MLFSRKQILKTVELPTFTFFKGASSFQEWLASLPVVDGQVLARHMLEATREINQTECEYEQLLEIAKLLQDRYCGVRDTLNKNDLNTVTRKNIITLKQEFFARFGRMFIKVGMVAAQSDDLENAERFLPLASEALATSLISSYQLYRPPLTGGWLALHRGYLYLASKRGNTNLATEYSPNYKTVVALACLRPAQLNSESIDLLVQLIADVSKQVRLTSKIRETASHRISAGRDAAPLLIAEEQRNVDTIEDSIYVDLSALASIAEDSRCTNILKNHLDAVFQFKMLEKAPRVQTNEKLKMCIGIPTIHHEINAAPNFSEFIKSCANAIDEEDTPEYETNAWDSVVQGNWSSIESKEGLIELELQTGNNGETISTSSLDVSTTPDAEHDVEQVTALDKSDTGFLLSTQKNLKELESGALIGIQSEDSDSWQIAVIRWNQTVGNANKFGVQKIAVNPEPAAIKIIHSQHSGQFSPALVLSTADNSRLNNTDQAAAFSLGPDEHGSSLILAIQSTSLRSKTPIIFLDNSGSKKAIITETIEENADFIICKARIVES